MAEAGLRAVRKVKEVVNSEITIEEARALVANQSLWPLVRDFLWDFAPQVHESWIDSLKIEGSALSLPRVRRFILESLGVGPCFHGFPADDGSRLMLLDGATLLEISKWLGALALADDLRRVTDGKTVKALRAALPGVYPEVFGYTAYFPILGGEFKRSGEEAPGLPDEVAMAGFEILFSTMGDLPASLVSRLRFKLPKTPCANAPMREVKGAAALPSILKLLKLKFPEAHSLCCC